MPTLRIFSLRRFVSCSAPDAAWSKWVASGVYPLSTIPSALSNLNWSLGTRKWLQTERFVTREAYLSQESCGGQEAHSDHPSRAHPVPSQDSGEQSSLPFPASTPGMLLSLLLCHSDALPCFCVSTPSYSHNSWWL